MAILTVLNRPHAFHKERNALRLSHIATIYKYRLIRWQPIFLPYPLRLIANDNAITLRLVVLLSCCLVDSLTLQRNIIRIRRNLHLLSLHLRVMLQHKAHIRGTHASDEVRDAIQFLLLLAEHLVEHSLHTRFRHHPQINGILRKYILKQQVGHRLRVPPLCRLDHLVERDGRRAVEDKVEPHIAEIPVHGAHKQVLQQQLSNALLDDGGLRHVERPHPQAMHAIVHLNSGRQSRPPLIRVDNIHLMTLIAELPHQVSINPTCRDISQSRGHS